MTSRMLRRAPVGIDHSFAGLEHTVIEEARNKLSYRGGANLVSSHNLGNELRMALSTLDIKPFSPKSVSRYQMWMSTWLVQNPVYALFQLVILPLLMFVGARTAIGWFTLGEAATGWQIAGGIALAIVAIGSLIVWCAQWGADIRPRYQWQRRSISDTAQAVPAFALQTAMMIHDRLPKAELYIETLTERARDPKPMPDPFLVVSYGDYEAYVEVWDEPKFNAKRIK